MNEPPSVVGRRFPFAVQGVWLALLGGVLLVVFVILPGLAGLATPGPTPDPATPAADNSFTPTAQQWAGLKVRRVAQLDFAPMVRAEGRIALDDDLNTPVFSPYSGHVTRVLAHAGDAVVAGTPLFAVQSTELAQAENDMVTAQAALRTAHAQLELATANERRQHLLFNGHGAAQRDWQQSLVDLATAKGGLSSAGIGVTSVRNRLGILGVSDAGIRSIGEATDFARVSADSIVRAPTAGTITQRQLSPGQNIVGSVASQGTFGAVFVIGNLSRVWMVASAGEADAGRFHLGDEARVHVLAYPDRVFEGRITFVAPVIDPATHRLLLRADVANPDGALKPDMLAQFDIVTGIVSRVLAVPSASVVYEGAAAHVWVADAGRKALAIRRIDAGAEQDGLVEVRSGLAASDSVVTSGAVFIDRTLSGS